MVGDPYGPHIFGVVSLFGKVIVHDNGFRAEQARPVAVEYGQFAEEIARRYGLIILGSLAEWEEQWAQT